MIHTVKNFGIFDKAEVDVFLESSCFFYDSTDVDNLIPGSSAFSKSRLNIWKFTVYVLLKPGVENFEHYFASVWDEYNCAAVWAFFGIAFLWVWNENWLFQSCGHCLAFQICWHIECSTFTASSFRIWNNSTGTPAHPLAFIIVMLPKAHLISHSRMSDSRWEITPLWLSGLWRSFLYSYSVYSCHLFLISSASVSDTIQPSHPLSSPSPPLFNLSQHQCLFQWVSSSYHVAKVLEFQLHHQSFQWIFKDWFPLG